MRWQGAFALLFTVMIAGLVLLALGAVRDAGASGPTAVTSATKTVTIKGLAFHPPTLTVSKGTRVAFSNTTGEPHTATKAGSFDTKTIKPGKAVVVRFAHKGTFAYHCTFHPFMKGKIVVR